MSVRDESLDLSDSSVVNYHLSLEISLTGLSFALLNTSKNKYVLLESFLFSKVKTIQEVIHEMDKILLDFNFSNRPFKSVNINYKSKKFVFIPVPLFDKASMAKCLALNTELTNDETIIHSQLKNSEAINVFAIEQVFTDFITAHFSQYTVQHYLTGLVETLLGQNKNTLKEATLFVNVSEYTFDVILIDQSELIFCNSFDYQSSEDFVYYLLFVCEQLKLNPETIKLKLSGEIEKNSALYSIILKYIRHVEFVNRSDMFDFSYRFYEMPDHFYYSLINQYMFQ